jgi:hypothetical protein
VFFCAMGITALIFAAAHLHYARRLSVQGSAVPPRSLSPVISAILYAAVGVGLLTLGITRAQVLARATVECRHLLTAAGDSHTRLAVLRRTPTHAAPAMFPAFPLPTCGRVIERYGP